MRLPASSAILALLTGLLVQGTAQAHGLGAECTLRNGRVEVEAYYDDDTQARGARVRLEDGEQKPVTDFPILRASALGWLGTPHGQFLAAAALLQGGSVLGQGQTDKKGRWSCPAPFPGSYVVFVDAGAGHTARRKITIQGQCEMAEAASAAHNLPPRASDSGEVISEGPRRSEFTAIPWERVFLGLGLLGIVSVGLWLLVRHRQQGGGVG